MKQTKYIKQRFSTIGAGVAMILMLCFGFTIDMSATHVVGGNIYYECLGNDKYKVVLEFRRDCFNGAVNAQFDDPVSVGVFDTDGNLMTALGLNGELRIPFTASDTLNEILTSECKIVGQDVCVHRTTYIDTVTLPANDEGYVLAYQRCCRTGTLTNVVDPLETGATHWVAITPEAIRQCNSSAVFNQWPDIYLCANEDFTFDHSATDMDGDSLVYKFCAPSLGGTIDDPKPTPPSGPPFTDVAFAAPYSLMDLMGGGPLFIDPNTGIITGRPDIVGQFLIGICVEEYRDGEVISTTRRDFEYNVRLCSNSPVSDFDMSPNPNCESLSMQFENSSEGDTYEWFFEWPDTATATTSTDENPSYTFPTAGSYEVVLVTTEGTCTDTLRKEIGVSTLGDPTVNMELLVTACSNEFDIQLNDLTTTSQNIMSWDWTLSFDGNSYNSTDQNPNFNLTGNDGILLAQLIVTTESGCTGQVRENIDLQSVTFELASDTLTICAGESIGLVSIADQDANYFWTPAHSLELSDPSSPIATPIDNTTYQVTVSAGACQYTEMITIIVDDPLDFDILIDSTTLCDEQIRLYIEGFDDMDFAWYLSSELAVPVSQGNEFFFSPIEGGQDVFAGPLSGACQDLESIFIESGNFRVNIANTINQQYCVGEGVQILLQPSNPNYSYTYDIVSTLPVLANSGDGNITLFADQTGSYTFSYLVTNELGCEFMGSVDFMVDDRIQLDLAPEMMICPSDTQVELNPGGNTTYVYNWTSIPDGLISDPSAINPIVDAVDGAVFTVEINVPDNALCSNTQEVKLTILDEINFGVSNLQEQYCRDGAISLTAQSEQDMIAFEWTTLSGNILSSSTDVTFDALQQDSLVLFAISEFGCIDSIIVAINYYDEPELVTNIDTQTLCQNAVSEITVLDDIFQSYEWLDANGNTLATSASFNYDVVANTTLMLTVTDNNRCSFSKEITVSTYEPIVVEANADFESFCANQESILTIILPQDSVDYSWFDLDDNLLSDSTTFDYFVAENTQLIIVATDQNNCSFTRSVRINTFEHSEILVNADTEQFCANADAEIFVIDSSDEESYKWFDADGNLLSINASFSYSVIESTILNLIVEDINGCSFERSVRINTFDSPDISLNSDFMQFCSGSQVTLQVLDPDNNNSYNWYNTNGDLLVASTSLVTTVTATTVFVVEAISADGCITRRTVTPTLFPVFDIELSGNDTQFCTNGETTLEVLNPQPNVSYTWFDSAGQALTMGTSLDVNINADTEYIVRAVDENGCQSEQELFVRTYPAVDVEIIGLADNYCIGGELSLSYDVTSAGSFTTEWIAADGSIISSEDELNITVSEGQEITLVLTDTNGCQTEQNILINTYPALDIRIVGLEDNYCFGDELDLTYDITSEGPISAQWLAEDGSLLGSFGNLNLDVFENQQITLILTDQNGCINEEIFDINVSPELVFEFDGINNNEVFYCAGGSVIASITGSSNYSYTWMDENGNTVGTGIDIEYMPTASESLTVTATNDLGCSREQTLSIMPYELMANIEGESMICAGNTSSLSLTDISGDQGLSFVWSPINAINGDIDGSSISISPDTTTDYQVVITNDAGCSWVESYTVVVNEFAEVLEVFVSSDVVSMGNDVTLSTNLDESLYDFEWFPTDDLDDPFSAEPTAMPSEAGLIEYTVIVTDDNGCTITGTVTLEARDGNCDESDVFVPNMFTPNGDNSNDIFRPKSNLISSLTMIVYDRWGEKLYETSDLNGGWDGTYQGVSLNPDVYGYHLRVECINGIQYEKQGNVTLVK